jgi:hypothetical protein
LAVGLDPWFLVRPSGAVFPLAPAVFASSRFRAFSASSEAGPAGVCFIDYANGCCIKLCVLFFGASDLCVTFADLKPFVAVIGFARHSSLDRAFLSSSSNVLSMSRISSNKAAKRLLFFFAHTRNHALPSGVLPIQDTYDKGSQRPGASGFVHTYLTPLSFHMQSYETMPFFMFIIHRKGHSLVSFLKFFKFFFATRIFAPRWLLFWPFSQGCGVRREELHAPCLAVEY